MSASELAQVSFADLYSSNYDLLQQVLLGEGRYDDLLELTEERRGRSLLEHSATRGDAKDSPPGLDLEGMRRIADGYQEPWQWAAFTLIVQSHAPRTGYFGRFRPTERRPYRLISGGQIKKEATML